MRFSSLFWVLLLSCTLARAQVVLDVPGNDRPNVVTPADCISLISFDLPTSFDEQIREIQQTGVPYGQQTGYTHIINRGLSCLPTDNLVVTFAKTGACQSSFDTQNSRAYTAQVLFNGEVVASRDLEGIGSETITVPLHQLGLDNVPVTPQIVPLELRVVEHVYGLGFGYSDDYTYALAQVMVVDFGTELYFQHERPDGYVTTTLCNRVALQDLDNLVQNCSASQEITLDLQMTNFTSNSASNAFTATYNATATIGGNGTLGYQRQGPVEYAGSVGVSGAYTSTFRDEEILSNSSTLTHRIVLPPRAETGCSFLGLILIGRTTYLQSYIVGCSYLLPGDPTNEQREYYTIQPDVCTEPGMIAEECYPVLLNSRFRRISKELVAGDASPIAGGDCLLSITTDQIPAPDYGQTFIWEGPDGFTAFGQELENVPFGVYTLTVYDECGGETQYTIDPCEGGSSTSAWSFDQNLSQWCRTISCSGGEECDGYDYQECVTPDFGEWIYDAATGTACRPVFCPAEGTCEEAEQCVEVSYGQWDYYDNGLETRCRRDVLAGTELIEVEEHLATLTYDFDPLSEQCLEYVRCAGPRDLIEELVNVELEAPVYEDWSFEEFTEVCVRRVRCFDLSVEDVALDPDLDFENPTNTNWEDRNLEPQYLWEYNEGWGCVGYVFCDDFEAPIHPGNTDWELDFGQGQPIFTSVDYQNDFGVISCILDVDCEFNGRRYDTPEPFPPLTTDPIDPMNALFIGTPTNGYCEFSFQCGDLPPITVDRTFIGVQTGINEAGEAMCQVFCEGFQATTTHPEEVRCSSLSNYIADDDRLVAGKELQQRLYRELKAKAEAESQAAPQVHPNPFNKQLVLRNLPDQELRALLLNVDGRVLLEQRLAGAATANLRTNHLPNGIYLLVLLGENEELIYERRLIKVD